MSRESHAHPAHRRRSALRWLRRERARPQEGWRRAAPAASSRCTPTSPRTRWGTLGHGWHTCQLLHGPLVMSVHSLVIEKKDGARQEGNCWYWGTDGECDSNGVWMRETCPLSCAKLEACGAEPESPECARPFECPPARDQRQDCIRRALAGECRAGGTAASAWAPEGETRWASSHMVKKCSLSCHLLDPASVARAAVRPPVRPSPLVDAPPLFALRRRHSPSRCEIGHGAALLDGRCPSSKTRRLPWRRVRCREATVRFEKPPFTSPQLGLISPHLASSRFLSLTSPHLASLRLIRPRLTSPLLSPHLGLISPSLAPPPLTTPHLGLTSPHLASPRLTSPLLGCTRRVRRG